MKYEEKKIDEKKESPKKEKVEVKKPLNPEIEKIKEDLRRNGKKKTYSFKYGTIEV